MKKCLQKFKIVSGLFVLCFSASAQTLKTFTRNDAEIKTIAFNIYNGKETYQYYEDANGNYVKNGSYSLSGTNVTTIQGKKLTDTYKATATFKKDLMNGTLSILNNVTIVEGGKTTTGMMSFIAGYSNGIPHGKWTWKDNTDGYANSSEMTFTKGVLTGLYKYNYTEVNKESLTKSITKISGQFNSKGEFHGTWSETESMESVFNTEKEVSELLFSNGILLSCVKRDATGKLLNPDSDRAEKKLLATKYANGEITKTALYEKGYIFEERKIKLYCPDKNNIGGDKLDSVILGKPFLELIKVNLATDSLISSYEEKELKDVEGNIEWAKAQNKNDNTDRIAKVRENYSFEHYYRSEEIGASLYYKYQRYYLNSSQINRLDSLKRIVDNRIDTEFKAIEAERLAEKQRKAAEEQQKAAEEQQKVQQKAEQYLNYALSGIVSISRNPTTKVLGIDMAIRNKCNLDENWKSVFYTEVNSVRYKKPDGSYGIETPQEVKLKSLFHNLHPITSYKILSYDVDEKGISKFLVEFEQKNKKKEPSKFFQGSIYVAKNGAILLDYSLDDLQEVTK
ncbi:MAG: cell envelope integrity protein TolA [Bacteroidales bacterium]|nr:cell envelope integrity protein TolA [Bacteroidales bacterium]